MPADIAAVIPARADRRQIFVVPWPDGDDVYLGTTDTDWDGPLDDPACTAARRRLCARGRQRLDDELAHPCRRDRAVGRTAPLARSRRQSCERAHEGSVAASHGSRLGPRSRDGDRREDDDLQAHGTTDGRCRSEGARHAGCKVANPAPEADRSPGRRRPSARGADLAVLEDLAGPRSAEHFGLSTDSMSALVRRHGTEAPAVLDLASGRPDLLEPLVEGLPYLKAEAVWAARHEMALTVDDSCRGAPAPCCGGPRRQRRRRPGSLECSPADLGTRPARHAGRSYGNSAWRYGGT